MNRPSGEWIVGNGVVADGAGTFLDDGALHIRDGRIITVAPTAQLRRDRVEFIDVNGRLIMPGFLNAHHHLYSSLAVGTSPIGPTPDFYRILTNMWWPLDGALDRESVYLSALVGLTDAVRHGVTMLFDHHASMGFVRGSLDLLHRAFAEAGIKGTLCFETSERAGPVSLEEQIEENLEFAAQASASPSVRGLFGLHANLTLGNDTLQRIADRKPADLPIHVHCGEDAADLEHCRTVGFAGPADRLAAFGLLSSRSLLVHAIHLSERDYERVAEIRPVIVTNPESNANNRVGHMVRRRMPAYVLGTDGMGCDMLATLRAHFLLGRDQDESWTDLQANVFAERYRVQELFFPDTGRFRPDIRADVAVPDYIPATPVSPDNLLGHLIFGAQGGPMFLTLADGRILFREGRVTFLDETALRREARAVAVRLHERYYG
ncbi:MAG: amidohydrolase family protein [Acidobacteria bacterium]|nr:amidohydrolase family protein [Acidobacteriota bacterium]